MARERVLTTAEGTNVHTFTPLDWGLLCTAGGIWGASFLFIAIGLDAFSPALITTLRITFGFCLLGLLPATRRTIPRSDWPRLFLLGTTWVAIPLSMFPLAEQHVSSAVTGMLNGATPLFAAFIATLMLGKLPPRQQLVGLAVGFAGVLLIGLASVGEESSSLGGIVLILIALCSYGVAYNIAGAAPAAVWLAPGDLAGTRGGIRAHAAPRARGDQQLVLRVAPAAGLHGARGARHRRRLCGDGHPGRAGRQHPGIDHDLCNSGGRDHFGGGLPQ